MFVVMVGIIDYCRSGTHGIVFRCAAMIMEDCGVEKGEEGEWKEEGGRG